MTFIHPFSEYVNHYAEPVASPSRSLEMMHRLSDYDGDGFITKWEQFMVSFNPTQTSKKFLMLGLLYGRL